MPLVAGIKVYPFPIETVIGMPVGSRKHFELCKVQGESVPFEGHNVKVSFYDLNEFEDIPWCVGLINDVGEFLLIFDGPDEGEVGPSPVQVGQNLYTVLCCFVFYEDVTVLVCANGSTHALVDILAVV